MTYSLEFRSRADREIDIACDHYESVAHLDSFIDELQRVLDAIETMPLQFRPIHGDVHRALLTRYPFAVFFRIRKRAKRVIVLAVLPQRGDPKQWPKR